MLTSYELHSLAMAVQICWLASPAVKELHCGLKGWTGRS